jgi:hypothetical protein
MSTSKTAFWTTFWSAISALAAVAAVIIALSQESSNPTGSAQPAVTVDTSSAQSRARSSTAQSPSADQPNLTAAESALADQLSSELFSSCEPERSEERNGVAAALNCDATGPPRRPLILQFETRDALTAWIENEQEEIVDEGNCTDGKESIGNWRNSGEVQGRIACTWKNRPLFRICWTYDKEMLAIVAEGTDTQALGDWWKKAAIPV